MNSNFKARWYKKNFNVEGGEGEVIPYNVKQGGNRLRFKKYNRPTRNYTIPKQIYPSIEQKLYQGIVDVMYFGPNGIMSSTNVAGVNLTKGLQQGTDIYPTTKPDNAWGIEYKGSNKRIGNMINIKRIKIKVS